ncbi:MAG: hypothetical protein U1E50_09755 [Caulobacteraceae bacterium]
MRAPLADDATVVARIFDHIDNHTTDLAEEVGASQPPTISIQTGCRRRSA